MRWHVAAAGTWGRQHGMRNTRAKALPPFWNDQGQAIYYSLRTGHGNAVLENAVARKHQPQTPHQQNTRTQTNKGNAMFGNALAEQEQRAEAAKMRQGNPVAKSSQGNPGRLESQQPKNQRQPCPHSKLNTTMRLWVRSHSCLLAMLNALVMRARSSWLVPSWLPRACATNRSSCSTNRSSCALWRVA